MATGYLGTDCTVLWGNTGITPCPYHPKNLEGFLLLPKDEVWTEAQVAALQTTINTGIAEDLPANRYYPITRFEDIEPKGTDAVETETGYGVAKFVRNGKYRWRAMYSNGALDLHSELSKFNGLQDRFDVMLVMKGNVLLCTAYGDSSVKGFSLDTIYAPNITLNTGGEDTKYAFEIGLEDESQLNINFRVITIPDTIPFVDSFRGLKPTRIEVVAHVGATTDEMTVRVWSGSTNLYDSYNGQLDTNTLWTLINNSIPTPTTTVSTSATAVPATKSFLLDFGSAVTAASQECIVKLGTVTAMGAAGLSGFANAQANTTSIA